MEKKTDYWAEAPEWAGAVIEGSGMFIYVEQWGGISEKRQLVGALELDDGYVDMNEPHGWELIALRPEAPKAIKSLEDRIKERALSDFSLRVESAMFKLRELAKGAAHKPTEFEGVNILQAINVVGAAIMKHAGPLVQDEALDRALEDLTDRLEPTNFSMHATPGPSRK